MLFFKNLPASEGIESQPVQEPAQERRTTDNNGVRSLLCLSLYASQRFIRSEDIKYTTEKNGYGGDRVPNELHKSLEPDLNFVKANKRVKCRDGLFYLGGRSII